MWPVCVCVCECLLDTLVSSAKMAEPIEVLLVQCLTVGIIIRWKHRSPSGGVIYRATWPDACITVATFVYKKYRRIDGYCDICLVIKAAYI